MGIDLNTIWFILITILFTGFFFLEGFDYGVGILVPVIGKTDDEKRVILNTIGPHWDGNEVWMLVELYSQPFLMFMPQCLVDFI